MKKGLALLVVVMVVIGLAVFAGAEESPREELLIQPRYTYPNTVKANATKYDGYNNALLRTGYDYVLRIAHRSNSPVSSASASGSWEP